MKESKLPENVRWRPERGEFYIDATRHGHRIAHSLHTKDVVEAKRLAKAELDAFETAWRAGRLDEFRQLANPSRRRERVEEFATVGEVLDRFVSCAREKALREKTVENYIRSLCQVCDLDEVELRKKRMDFLQPGIVRAFCQRMLGARDDESCRRSINSLLRQARACFAADVLASMEGLRLPDLKPFLEAPGVQAEAVQYNVPMTHPELVRRTPVEIRKLKDTEPDLWMACALMYGLAMRNSEAMAARWSWIVRDPSGTTDQHVMVVMNRPEEGFKVKAKGSDRRIPMTAEFYGELLAMKRDGDPYILPGGSATGRSNLVGRTLARWMRSIGWDEETFEKAGYELRKLRGSEWYTNPNIGPAQASAWLGHTSLETTCRYYARLTRQAQAVGM